MKNKLKSTKSIFVFLIIITFLAALPAIGARATYGAKTTADEPQYLLTALSIAEDFDLDISDEIAYAATTEAYRKCSAMWKEFERKSGK